MTNPKYRATQFLEIVMGGNSTEVEAELEFNVSSDVPEQGPSYASGGQPAEDGGVEDICCKGIKFAGKSADCPEWLREWIEDNVNCDALYEAAANEDDALRDEADEMRHESYREMRIINEDLGID